MKKIKKFLTLVLSLVIMISTISTFVMGASTTHDKTVQNNNDDDYLEMYTVRFMSELTYPDAEIYSWYEGPRWYEPGLGWVMKPEKQYFQINLTETVGDDIVLGLETWLLVEYFLWQTLSSDDNTDELNSECTFSEIELKNKLNERNFNFKESISLIDDITFNKKIVEQYDLDLSRTPNLNTIQMEPIINEPMEPLIGLPVGDIRLPAGNQEPVAGTLSLNSNAQHTDDECDGCGCSDDSYIKEIWYDLWTDENGITVDGKELSYERYNLLIDMGVDPEDYITNWFYLSDLYDDVPPEEDKIVYGYGIADMENHNIVINTEGLCDGEHFFTIYFKWMFLAPQIEYVGIIVKFNYKEGEGSDRSGQSDQSDEDNIPRQPSEPEEPAEIPDDPGEPDEPQESEEIEESYDISYIISLFSKREITLIEAITQIFRYIQSIF